MIKTLKELKGPKDKFGSLPEDYETSYAKQNWEENRRDLMILTQIKGLKLELFKEKEPGAWC